MTLPLHVQFPADTALLIRRLTDLFRDHAQAINALGSGGGGGGGVSALNDLSDVALSGLMSGQVLKYTGTEWINDTISGGASWTEAEIDFGSAPVYEAVFTLTDAAITGGSKVQVLPCGKAATGRTADDWAWDGATFAALPASGSATCYAHFMPGPIVGRRKVQYSVGA